MNCYEIVLAFLQHRPAQEIAALARWVQPAPDPEVNYFSAAHLAYCGRTAVALEMLQHMMEKGYCSYSSIDSDPFLARLRAKPEFNEIRSAALRCQSTFQAQRGPDAKRSEYSAVDDPRNTNVVGPMTGSIRAARSGGISDAASATTEF